MKRSEINAVIRATEEFIAHFKFLLPPMASWDVTEWERRDGQVEQIKRVGMGWDITDFGRGDFDNFGLVLFTLRNGLMGQDSRPYAEKLLVSRDQQKTLLHYHKVKTEDIIVRGGAPLALQLFNLDSNGQPDRTLPVTFCMDEIKHEVAGGDVVVVHPGESITLTPYCAHEFWGHGGTSLVGEVSSVNDDQSDNFFFSESSRFPTIEEDEEPYRLIVPDYLV